MRLRRVLSGAVTVASFLLLLQGTVLLTRNTFSETGICNDAGPFGWSISIPLLMTFFVPASIFFLVCWWREIDRRSALFWLLIVAAGSSNFLERWYFGCVFDYFSFGSFPLFNAADVLLTVSVVFLGWREILLARRPS